jgi:hypothetical protein
VLSVSLQIQCVFKFFGSVAASYISDDVAVCAKCRSRSVENKGYITLEINYKKKNS